MYIQTTFGTVKKRSLFRGGRYFDLQRVKALKKIFYKIFLKIKAASVCNASMNDIQ